MEIDGSIHEMMMMVEVVKKCRCEKRKDEERNDH